MNIALKANIVSTCVRTFIRSNETFFILCPLSFVFMSISFALNMFMSTLRHDFPWKLNSGAPFCKSLTTKTNILKIFQFALAYKMNVWLSVLSLARKHHQGGRYDFDFALKVQIAIQNFMSIFSTFSSSGKYRLVLRKAKDDLLETPPRHMNDKKRRFLEEIKNCTPFIWIMTSFNF